MFFFFRLEGAASASSHLGQGHFPPLPLISPIDSLFPLFPLIPKSVDSFSAAMRVLPHVRLDSDLEYNILCDPGSSPLVSFAPAFG